MFERDANNKLIGRNEPLFWAELPEFSHLQTYRSPDCDEKERQKATSLQEQIRKLHDVKDDAGMKGVVMDAFLDFLAKLTGFEKGTIDPGKSLGMYGVDSLSGVSTQYWFHRGKSFLFFSLKRSEVCPFYYYNFDSPIYFWSM